MGIINFETHAMFYTVQEKREIIDQVVYGVI